MTATVPSSLLDAVSKVMTERSGLRIDADRRARLEEGVCAAAGELGFESVEACAEWIVSSQPTPAQIGILAASLTVGETFFFREKASFLALEETILPEIIQARRGRDQRLRIWSAGCCTGEEAYSVAISVDRVLPDSKEWDIKLLGTDINPTFLKKATEAVYGEWSFRDDAAKLLRDYLIPTRGKRHRLTASLRRRVTFAPLNLAEDAFPSLLNGTASVDVILCRNVLMYLDEPCAAKVVRSLGECLSEEGWLLVGAAEGALFRDSGLAPANIPGVVAFRRRAGNADRVKPPVHAIDPVTKIIRAAPMPIVGATAMDERREHAQTAIARFPVGADLIRESNSLELAVRECANQGDLAQAMITCEKAILIEKLNPRLRYLHAMILQERGDLEQAAASFRRAIYLDPDFVMAHVGAGHLAGRMGNDKECGQHLVRARKLLMHFAPDQPVPESDGLDAQHLLALIAREAEKGSSK